MVKVFANFFWIYIPTDLQKRISNLFSMFFETKLSRFIIMPYVLIFGLTPDYLSQFESEAGQSSYESYSDFFRRRYKVSPRLQGQAVWPCEGYICDWGPIKDRQSSVIKGQKLSLEEIFSNSLAAYENHYYINIFLHNHNYHRIHMPTEGVIKSVKHVKGGLNFLRPWFYKRDEVSFPAYKNERVSVEFSDGQNQSWILTMVGGFGVGSIALNPDLKIGSVLKMGEELGMFKMGSTVCLACPYDVRVKGYLDKTFVGQSLKS